MPKFTYADEIDANFGIPWTDDLRFNKGELECALSNEESGCTSTGSCRDA